MQPSRRYLTRAIADDALAKRKMAFVSGPRQVGKSTLAKMLLSSSQNYFLYDDEGFRRAWAKSPQQAVEQRGGGPVVLDEIHKDRAWKRKVKGLYDLHGDSLPRLCAQNSGTTWCAASRTRPVRHASATLRAPFVHQR